MAFIVNPSFAQSEGQIVYLDLDNIVSNTKAGKSIINNLEKSKKKVLSKFEKKEKELKKIENNINKQKNILSEDELKKKLVEFRKEISKFQNERQKVINNFNKIVILIFFYFQHVRQSQKMLRIVVQFLMKDIFGINMQKKQSKNGEHLFIFN